MLNFIGKSEIDDKRLIYSLINVNKILIKPILNVKKHFKFFRNLKMFRCFMELKGVCYLCTNIIL